MTLHPIASYLPRLFSCNHFAAASITLMMVSDKHSWRIYSSAHLESKFWAQLKHRFATRLFGKGTFAALSHEPPAFLTCTVKDFQFCFSC
jgi:hypothetical protein